MVERFFCEQLVEEVETLDNLAYRKNLSCTSLLISQFNTIAIEPTTYVFNGDIQKAFNSMSRKSVLDSIGNSHLRNILSSWMDRSLSPYLINWGNSYKEIARDSWSSGIEPGSNLGPPLFLKGLNCKDKVYLRAIPGQKNLFADDGAPLYKLISTLARDAADYISHVMDLHMKLHTTGSKALSYMALGKVDSELSDLNLTVESQKYTIQRVYNTRQLGLFYSVDKNGRYLISISHYISKLKNAFFSLSFVAKFLPSSVLVVIIKAYLMSVVSYGINIYYPILWFHNHPDLDSLRYWYTSLQALASAGCRDVMSWSNRTKTLKQGSCVEEICAELTGIPTLEELYLFNAASHYPQLLKMHKLDFLGPSVRLNKRTNRLAFIGNTQKGRISPLEPLFMSINNVIDSDLTKLKGSMKSECFLKQFECNDFRKDKIRTLQIAISLACFDLLETERSKKKFTADEWVFLNANSKFIKSKVSSLKAICRTRKTLHQSLLKAPLQFTTESRLKLGNKSNYRKEKEARSEAATF